MVAMVMYNGSGRDATDLKMVKNGKFCVYFATGMNETFLLTWQLWCCLTPWLSFIFEQSLNRIEMPQLSYDNQSVNICINDFYRQSRRYQGGCPQCAMVSELYFCNHYETESEENKV